MATHAQPVTSTDRPVDSPRLYLAAYEPQGEGADLPRQPERAVKVRNDEVATFIEDLYWGVPLEAGKMEAYNQLLAEPEHVYDARFFSSGLLTAEMKSNKHIRLTSFQQQSKYSLNVSLFFSDGKIVERRLILNGEESDSNARKVARLFQVVSSDARERLVTSEDGTSTVYQCAFYQNDTVVEPYAVLEFTEYLVTGKKSLLVTVYDQTVK